MWTSALKAHQTRAKLLIPLAPSEESTTHILLKKLGCCLIYFPDHFFNYWEWFDTDSTCNVSEYFFVVVSNSWGQITQLSCLQCGRPPQSTLQVAVSAAVTGLRATWAPWKPETSELWWDGLANRLGTLATLAGQHEMEMFSRILLKAGLCVWLLVLALFLCLFKYWSICFPPSSPLLGKEMSYWEDKQANKNPTLVFFHFHPHSPPVLTPTSNCAFSDVHSRTRHSTALHDESRSPSKCDLLPALSPPHI